MKTFFIKLFKMTQSMFTLQMTYRIGIWIWMLNGLLPLVTMFVWMNIANDNPINGRTSSDFINYFLAVIVVGQLMASPILSRLDSDIRYGYMSNKLLLPINPYWSYVSEKISITFFTIPFLVIPIAIVYFFLGLDWKMDLFNVSLFFISLIGSIILQFHRQFSMGLISFWSDKTLATSRVWESLNYILSGAFAPIDMFPLYLQKIILLSPFPYVIYFPVAILNGNLSNSEVFLGFFIQYSWGIIFVFLYRLLWYRGLKRYGAVGA